MRKDPMDMTHDELADEVLEHLKPLIILSPADKDRRRALPTPELLASVLIYRAQEGLPAGVRGREIDRLIAEGRIRLVGTGGMARHVAC